MALAAAGYSEKPLAAKLGYKAGQRALFIALPAGLAELARAAAFETTTSEPSWDAKLPARSFDLIHAFTKSRAELENNLRALQSALKPDGTIWVSWPKKAAKVPTDVTEDRVREAALRLDLVDVKVAALDSVWSGLKLVIRRERR